MLELHRPAITRRPAPRAVAPWAVLVLVAGLVAAPPLAAAGAGADEAFPTPLPIPEEYTDADIELVATEADVQILDGQPTRMWTFDGQFPGPTIRRPAGAHTRVTVRNELPAEAGSVTVHNHGNPSESAHDGRPEFPIERGEAFTYDYPSPTAGSSSAGRSSGTTTTPTT